ncbi:replication initiator [Streptomyces sp. NPDC059740]|uniref:replication initiator n=1 Tax=Streptomyces sp. NPDC059740 TaxID=3346926 RepID=UPI00365E09C0
MLAPLSSVPVRWGPSGWIGVGFPRDRGHFSTTSRSYSTTLGALREARRSWRTEQARIRAGLPDLDPTTTLVVGRWDYLGSGCSPGAALLAAHVWHRKELERQFATEGGC